MRATAVRMDKRQQTEHKSMASLFWLFPTK
jgi:hypothetical protein